ncbi:ComF family protein [Allomuricauda sp. SCSIO 65647]|uniref:ComF family protein n=1 Tax=Allomuricauda sp. SCSIO 65647 TaxID=2908843 RepID=UPI001F2A958D|nr:phosphoribosyltransferase family protein [Muricauda sp. SCSIO 65647]UJH66087.1 ComF family protein [Muricauda sp. SCSIO 65647]
MGGEHHLCTVCRHDLPLTEYNFREENAIDRIFYGHIAIIKASAFLHFSAKGKVKNLLHQLKYKNQEDIGNFLGDWYGSLLEMDEGLPNIDYIVPVPLHAKKLRKRGYNQVHRFAQQLANHLNSSVVDHVLVKTANVKTQTQKDRSFRWQSSKNLYELGDEKMLRHRKVLLVDDVITTGATIEACAQALSETEGIEIYVAAMAVVSKTGI